MRSGRGFWKVGCSSMTNPVHYAGDDLVVKCTVSFDKDAPFTNLTGAVIDVKASSMGGASIAASAATVAGNDISIVYNKATLAVGIWTFHVRATKAARTKTVAVFTIDVQASL